MAINDQNETMYCSFGNYYGKEIYICITKQVCYKYIIAIIMFHTRLALTWSFDYL